LGKFGWFSCFTTVNPAASNTRWNVSTHLAERTNHLFETCNVLYEEYVSATEEACSVHGWGHAEEG